MNAKEKKAAFVDGVTRLEAKLKASGLDFERDVFRLVRVRGSYKDILSLQHATHRTNDVTLQVSIESNERLEAEERLGFYRPSGRLTAGLISTYGEPGQGPMGGYNLDYGPELVVEAMVKDVIMIAIPAYQVTDLIESYDPDLHGHRAFREGIIDEGITSLYFSRGKVDEGLHFLRGLDRSYTSDPPSFIQKFRNVASLEAKPPTWPPFSSLAEVFFRYEVDPLRLYR